MKSAPKSLAFSNPNSGYGGRSRFGLPALETVPAADTSNSLGLQSNWGDLGSLGKFSVGMQGLSSLAGLFTGIGQYNEMKKMNKFNRYSATLDARNQATLINENNANKAMMANQMGGNSQYQKVSGEIADV